ncbi:MAG: nickel-responsive transcriptional regulator NikR [SAR324 cluster bacterium]|nr:nickel-responsive transcriptional regulator NikR [SAR324 cluster bacterium]
MENKLTRFGVSIPEKLLNQFDDLIARKGYQNRSEAIRDSIRNTLVEEEWEEGTKEAFGTLTIVYNHHHGDVDHSLKELQHEYFQLIISNVHVHIDHHLCLEVLIIRGTNQEIKEASDKIISLNGVLYGKLTAATAGRKF